jgi:hypothetical protein
VIGGTVSARARDNIEVRPLVGGGGMAQATIGIRNTVTLGYAAAVERPKRALQERGLGVFSVIDTQQKRN